MELKTLNTIKEELKQLPDTQSQTQWVRAQCRHVPNDRSIRQMPNFVPGTEHPAWISYEIMPHGVKFTMSSDSNDTQGVAGIVVRALDGLTAKEIRSINFSEFRDIARYLNNRQQRTLNALLNRIKDIIGEPHG